MNDLKLFKEFFDPYLKDYLDHKIQKTTKYTKDPYIQNYIFYIKKMIMSGGKRIRPFIAYLMYKALGGKEKKKALKLLVSLEIFHTFCLVHDDIMDKAIFRHGTTSIHKYVTNKLQKEKSTSDVNHVGNSQAILIGDLLFSWSQEILNINTEFSEIIINKVKKLIYEMVDEVIIGQMIDINLTTIKNVTKELIDEKTFLKTAGYSIIKPLQIGAVLANKYTKGVDKFCKEFGTRLGIAFQMQDDLFDELYSTKQLGKTSSLDKSQNQHTYFSFFKSPIEGKRIIKENFDKAKKSIANLRTEEIYKQKFFSLVKIIEERKF